jgi:hypothetical protein
MEESEGPNNDAPEGDHEKNVNEQEYTKDTDGRLMQCLKQSLDLSLEKFYSSLKYVLYKLNIALS